MIGIVDKIEKSIFHQLVSRDRLFLFSFFICAGLTIAGGWVGGNLYLNRGGDVAKVDKIELFCQEIVKGSSQRQAYYAAYPSSMKWKPETVDSKASVLANSDKVLERLSELREEIKGESKISRNEIINQLKKIGFADIPDGKIQAKDKVKALDSLIKILGYDKPSDSENGQQAHNELMKAIKRISDED